MRIVVDFPAPLGPSRPVTLPGATVKLRSSTATLSPKTCRRFSTSIIRAPSV